MPRPVHYCADSKIIGTEFYVMEYVEGRIFTDLNLPGLNPAERRQVYEELVGVLAKLHSYDPK